MNTPLIWLHDEALRLTHPVFRAAPAHAKTVYLWDDGYFREAGYSLKRLIFIYETLCELPADIIQGNTLDIIRSFAPSTLYVPATHNPLIMNMVASLKAVTCVQTIDDEAFTVISKPKDYNRFFQYWNKAEKTAFHT